MKRKSTFLLLFLAVVVFATRQYRLLCILSPVLLNKEWIRSRPWMGTTQACFQRAGRLAPAGYFCAHSQLRPTRANAITLHRPQWPPHRDARSPLPAECLVSRRGSDELLYEGHCFNAADGEYRHVAPSRCTTRFPDRKSLGILYPL